MFSFFSSKNKAPESLPEQRPSADVLDISNAENAVTAKNGARVVFGSAWLQRLKSGLAKTSGGLQQVFTRTKIDEDLFEALEEVLLLADTGTRATEQLLQTLRKKIKEERLQTAQEVREALVHVLTAHLQPLEKFLGFAHSPTVLMMVGVNGAGKTTSIGKLAHHFRAAHLGVLLAAGDTFRAAAREQLLAWGEKNNVAVIAQESGDPAAVAFDAVHAARARGLQVALIDTAGRLPTQNHLMEELKKIKRVLSKADALAPHEVLLVIDGNTGQNALAQVKAFDDAVGLTGLIITKLDGTAKGGILAAIASERPIPVYFIGVGEGVEDLQVFNAAEFARALVGV